jgi:hypothetical protein
VFLSSFLGPFGGFDWYRLLPRQSKICIYGTHGE